MKIVNASFILFIYDLAEVYFLGAIMMNVFFSQCSSRNVDLTVTEQLMFELSFHLNFADHLYVAETATTMAGFNFLQSLIFNFQIMLSKVQ